MALIVPARRDLALENLAGVLESQQELRIQRETREHAEGVAREARDKQLTAIAVGAVVGGVGGLALGAGVAGGITAAQGLQVASLGANIGGQIASGNYGGAITTGLQGATQLLQAEQNRQTSEQQKQLNFIKWGTQQFGGGFGQDFKAISAENIAEARAAGLPEPSPTQLRTQFLQASGQQLQDRLLEYEGAKVRTRGIEALNVQKIAKFNAAQIDDEGPNATGLPVGYNFTPRQAQEYQGIAGTEKLIRDQRASIEPQEFNRLIRENQREMNNLALRVKVKPPTPVSRQALARSGQAPKLGSVITDEAIPGAFTSISSNGSVNQWTPPDAVFDVGPNTRFKGNGKDAAVPHSKRIGGEWREVGQLFIHPDFPDEGLMYLDPKTFEPKHFQGKSGAASSDVIGDALQGVMKLKDLDGSPSILGMDQAAVTESLTNIAVGTLNAQQNIKRIQRVFAFKQKWSGAQDFDTIFADMIRNDERLGKLDAMLQKILSASMVGRETPDDMALRRGIAKEMVVKLGAIKQEVGGLESGNVKLDYLRMVARLESLTR